ncbi:MAG: ethanolamine ammonia-lyase reactivating factor EutA [Candidatus Lokiarchaeota archaeon]|nr:ethanolamine ammonia-lyase reactivating factor EutA [Candidatus Lokiarchaeota archaeon]
MNNKERMASISINIDSQKNALIYYVREVLGKENPNEIDSLEKKFTEKYNTLLEQNIHEDMVDLEKFYQLIRFFKPALSEILKPGKSFDMACDLALQSFNVPLNRIRQQINADYQTTSQRTKTGPILPGTNKSLTISFVCASCKEEIEIPQVLQNKILNGLENFERPIHHGNPMEIKISRIVRDTSEDQSVKKIEKIEIPPAELLMGHMNTSERNVEYLKLISVGIDIGSSTSHLVFSRLTLQRERSFFNMTNRFNLINREIIYKGSILMTPLLSKEDIDIEAVIEFCKKEYENAGMTPEQVDTGAVIVTGETAKKQNADLIVERLSSETGKFVSATAGPNFESLLGIMGSGMVKYSSETQKTVMNVDVGGGTSNLAIASNGVVHSCSCINIGGRLLGIDNDFKIWRIDGPCEFLMKELNMNYRIGDIIPEVDVKKIAHEFAKALVEVMQGPATSKIAKWLMMTADLDVSIPVNEYSFSGGVAEFIYSTEYSSIFYNDIGKYLADEIKALVSTLELPIIEPVNKIRATVIGAGSFSLSVSGSTCYYDENIPLPIKNVPVITIPFKLNDLTKNKDALKNQIDLTLKTFDMEEGKDLYALYFKELIRPTPEFIEALANALPNSIAKKSLIIIILRFDGAKVLGLALKKNTQLRENLFCLDELELETGDWIDIGAALKHKDAFPVTIKSLVFNQNKPFIQTEQDKLDIDKTLNAFEDFQQNHEGYEKLLILNSKGEIELSSDPNFCTAEEARNLLSAWKEHKAFFTIGDNRYPILSSEELQFAAGSNQSNGYIVGSKTKNNRYALVNITKGPILMRPNIARVAAIDVNKWSWDLI